MRTSVAKTKKPVVSDDIRHTWVCEGCGSAHEGVNPPDKCFCGHEYFENMFDLVKELGQKAVH